MTAQPPSTMYVCPMHPEVVKDRPGMCPLCGMNLVPSTRPTAVRDTTHYDKHAGHDPQSFLKKFFIVSLLTLPILAYSDILTGILPFTLPPLPAQNLLILTLGTIIFFYGGSVFLAGSARELSARLPGMMTLIALALVSAYSFSVFAVLSGTGENLFWELATLTAIMLLGHWIEMKAVKKARGSLQEIAKLLPDTAVVEHDGQQIEIQIAELVLNNIAVVKPGSRIPADGVVESGQSDIDESVITGESRPVSKGPGDTLIAGSINGDGALRLRVTKTGEGTFLAGIARLVANAESSKSRLQILSDRAALALTVTAVSAGTATFIAWSFAGATLAFSAERLVAVLVIACPHALGLAIPLVASISTHIAARKGFLVKNRLALETARTVNMVLFDKTGTLTKGEFGVDAIIPKDISEQDLLAYAATVNNYSEHPIAKAIVAEARKRNTIISPVQKFERIPGKGARGEAEGAEYAVGNDSMLADMHITLPAVHAEQTATLARAGKTIVHVVKNGVYAGSIALSDTVRTESREAVSALRALGIDVAMITGDSADVASAVAGEIGITEFFSGVLPSEKSEKVKLLQKRGLKVAMVGDGVNDAPALAQADVGIAVGAGTNVAIESAGIILMRNDPRDISAVIALSRATYDKMIQNLWWATGYNIVALPLAAGVLAWAGFLLAPSLSAVFMSLSTVIVAGNALLLKRAYAKI